jgi:hypothetical protein
MKVSSFFERNKTEAEIPRDQSTPAGKQTAEKKEDNKEWKKAISEDVEDDVSSAVSDISASTEGDVRDQGESLDERSETFQRFEKTLRAKHTKACKAMSVSSKNFFNVYYIYKIIFISHKPSTFYCVEWSL